MKNQKNNLTRSPLHYNGNKYDIANQILDIIDMKHSRIIEIFSGTAIISLNSQTRAIWLNDNDDNLLALIIFIKNFNDNDEKEIIELTNKYKLTSDMNNFKEFRINNGTKGYSNNNKIGYLKLRERYNNSKKKSILELFILINYSFNRMIRFNKKGEFNVPVGKGDWSIRQKQYVYKFKELLNSKKIKITNKDFRKIYKKFSTDDFIYIDPPYLNGTAQYNSNWTIKDEEDLYIMIKYFQDEGIKFALSNTIFMNGKENLLLKRLLKENTFKIFNIEKHYSKTSYNKKNRYDAKEILVTNL